MQSGSEDLENFNVDAEFFVSALSLDSLGSRLVLQALVAVTVAARSAVIMSSRRTAPCRTARLTVAAVPAASGI
jgi:hypothetical protein